MMEKLWGNNFFDSKSKKWTKKSTGAETCKRGFVQFVYEPIKTVIEACMNDNREKLYGLTDKLGFTLKAEQKELTGKQLMKACMQAWIPASEVPPPSPIFCWLLDLLPSKADTCRCINRPNEPCLPHKTPSLFCSSAEHSPRNAKVERLLLCRTGVLHCAPGLW